MHTSHPPRLSALVSSDTRPAQGLDEQAHEATWSMFYHCLRPVPTTSCRGQKGILDTYGVSPQQVETGQLLQCPDPSGPGSS